MPELNLKQKIKLKTENIKKKTKNSKYDLH